MNKNEVWYIVNTFMRTHELYNISQDLVNKVQQKYYITRKQGQHNKKHQT